MNVLQVGAAPLHSAALTPTDINIAGIPQAPQCIRFLHRWKFPLISQYVRLYTVKSTFTIIFIQMENTRRDSMGTDLFHIFVPFTFSSSSLPLSYLYNRYKYSYNHPDGTGICKIYHSAIWRQYWEFGHWCTTHTQSRKQYPIIHTHAHTHSIMHHVSTMPNTHSHSKWYFYTVKNIRRIALNQVFVI